MIIYLICKFTKILRQRQINVFIFEKLISPFYPSAFQFQLFQLKKRGLQHSSKDYITY